MGILDRLKGARLKAVNRQEVAAQEYRVRSAQRQLRRNQRIVRYEQSDTAKIQNRLASYRGRLTPGQPQKFYKARTQILRTIGARSQSRLSGKNYAGKGRPKGSYKYFIPGRGQVDVFTWRKYIAQQKANLSQNIQQQIAMQRARAKTIQKNYPELPQSFQQQLANPYAQYTQQPIAPVQPSLKEISILERTPFTPGSAYAQEDGFIELDLMSGKPKQKTRGNLM